MQDPLKHDAPQPVGYKDHAPNQDRDADIIVVARRTRSGEESRSPPALTLTGETIDMHVYAGTHQLTTYGPIDAIRSAADLQLLRDELSHPDGPDGPGTRCDRTDVDEFRRTIGHIEYDAAADAYSWELDDEFRADDDGDDSPPVPWEFDLSKDRPDGVSEPAPVAARRREYDND